MEAKKNKIIAAFMSVILGILSYQGGIAASLTGEGLDSSATYALSYFFSNNIKFGRDVVFTYGPLGFLCWAKNIDSILPVTLAFWALMSAVFSIGFYVLISRSLSEKSSRIRVVVGYVLTLFPIFIFAEYYYLFVCIMSALLALKLYSESNKKLGNFFLAVTDILVCLSIFIKFSLTIQILSSLILMIAAMFIVKNPSKLRFLINGAGSVIAAFVLYLVIYDHSFENLFNYIKGSLEMSSGYNWAMSLKTDYDVYYILVIILVISYLAGFFLNLGNRMNVILFAALAGPSFFMYKHGFVRSDGHIYIFFQGMIAILAFFLLFYNTEQDNETKLKFLPESPICRCISVIIACASLIPIQAVERITPQELFQSWDSLANIPVKLRNINNEPFYESNNLSQEFVSRIQDYPVSIYPMNILYNRNNDLNYVPLYGVQAYSIYTPWLDEKTADVFSSVEKPEYIITDIQSIDNRWFLIDTPQTSWTIRNNYYVDYYESGKFLLKKRDNPIVDSVELSKTEKKSLTDTIDVSEGGFVKIDADLSLWGKFVDLVYKIPEVNMTVNYTDGSSFTKRVILQNFSAGVDLSSVVYSEDQFVDYMNYSGNLSEVSSVSFSGDGLKYFTQEVTVEYYTVSESRADISIDSYELYSPERNYSDLGPVERLDSSGLNMCVDFMTYQNDSTNITGWIYDTENNSSFDEIYLHSGDKLYRLKSGEREDVQNTFSLGTSDVGFNGRINSIISESDYTFVVKPHDKETYYEYSPSSVSIDDGTQPDMEYAERYELSEVSANPPVALEADYSIDVFNVDGNTTEIAGWIIDSSINGSFDEVYLQNGDELFKLNPAERPDVQKAYGLETDNIGFTAVIDERIETYSLVAKRVGADDYYQISVA